MKSGHSALTVGTLIAIVGSALVLLVCTCANYAASKPRPASGHASPMAEHSGFKIPSAHPEWAYPISVTLSPDDARLAVVTINDLLVRDLRSNKWVRNFGYAYSVAARWHPTRDVIIAAGGDAEKPDYNLAYLSSGKKRQVCRGGAGPLSWTTAGLLTSAGHDEVVLATVDLNKARVTRSGNFGHRLPWDKADVRYISSAGPDDQVAAELEPMSVNTPHWMEMYRRVPGQKQWVRTGMVKPEMKGKNMVWYPRNPIWLGDGRLMYLRIYEAEWVFFRGGGSNINPKAWTARNRAELWMCDATGANQKMITTIWDLRPYVQSPETDWITIDRRGENVYYLSGNEIRHLSLASK